jgi:transmembrane sensor
MNASNRRARAAAEAAQWWIRIESGDLSREAREQFVDWLRESAIHVAEMLRMAEVHGALERFHDWVRIPTDEDGAQSGDNVVPFEPVQPQSRQHAGFARDLAGRDSGAAATVRASGAGRRGGVGSSAGEASPSKEAEAAPTGASRRRWIAGFVLAATVAVIGVFLALFPGTQVIETGRAERRSITLADGSVLQIDPESRLRIRLTQQERDVSLERGRAHFRVAKDPSRPFVVRAEATQVRAVGTQFGVEQSREGIVVTVAEGKVAVLARDASRDGAAKRDGAGSAPPPVGPAGTSGSAAGAEVLLSAGEQVIVPRRGPAEAVRAVDTDRELAWVAGRLVFDNDSVADVIEEFNRYNVVQLHVASPQLAQRSVSGVFDASEPESFIGFIQSVAPVNVRRAGQDITIALAPP